MVFYIIGLNHITQQHNEKMSEQVKSKQTRLCEE